MIARHVTLHLKPNTAPEFNRMLEKDVLPMLRKQKGFLNEFTLMHTNGTENLAISLWDKKESAEIYNRDTYPQVVKTFEKLLAETPVVRTFEVGLSTLQDVAIPTTV
jgi:quinol monooxygenase YgiN